MQALPIYASLLAIFYVYLSLRTIGLRRKVKVAVGDGGSPEMLRAMRVHGNFAEYVPIALILLGLLEMQGAYLWLVHTLGCVLVAARLSHAYGVSKMRENFRFRISGMMGTFATIVTSALALLGMSIWRYV